MSDLVSLLKNFGWWGGCGVGFVVVLGIFFLMNIPFPASSESFSGQETECPLAVVPSQYARLITQLGRVPLTSTGVKLRVAAAPPRDLYDGPHPGYAQPKPHHLAITLCFIAQHYQEEFRFIISLEVCRAGHQP